MVAQWWLCSWHGAWHQDGLTQWISFPRVSSQSVSGPWTQPRFTWALGRS